MVRKYLPRSLLKMYYLCKAYLLWRLDNWFDNEELMYGALRAEMDAELLYE